jgi:hypothetical protein
MEAVRGMMVLKACGRDQKVLDLAESTRDALARLQDRFSMDALLYFMQLLMESRRRLREGLSPQLVLEVAFVKMSQVGQLVSLGDAIKALQSGAPVPPPPRKAEPAPASPASPAPAAPPPPTGEATLESIAARWPSFVGLIREQDVLISAVLADCRPSALRGGVLTVAVPDKFNSNFHRDKIKRLQDLKAVLEDATRRAFGSPLRSEFAFEGAPAPKPVDTSDDPSIQKIVEKFQGIRIIESE